MSKNTSGFTLVELLIVIVVIAILAAISVVAYNGVQDRARTSAVQSDLNDARKRLMLYEVEHGRPPVTASELTDASLRISSTSNYDVRTGYTNYYYCVNRSSNQFALGARVATSQNNSYYISSTNDVTHRAGLISSGITCGLLGLGSTASADAFTTSGLNSTGGTYSWLQAGS